MRCFAALAILCFGVACGGVPTEAGPLSLTDTYMLKSVDRETLPAPLDPRASSNVLSGSLTLQPNGYFVLAGSDSSWNGRSVVRDDWTDGGTWTADGSMLILSDTAAEAFDTYGAAASTYFGRIAAHTVSLTMATNDGSKTHLFEYTR